MNMNKNVKTVTVAVKETKKEKVNGKGFYDNTMPSTIKLIGEIVIVLLLIGVIFSVWWNVKGNIDKANKDISNYGVIADESKYTDNDGRYLTGNQVLGYLRTWANDDVCVKVITKSNTAGTFYNYKNFNETTGLTADDKLSSTDNNHLISAAGNKTATNYINPNAQFFCEIKRDQNDVIVAVVLTQQ